MFTFSITLDLIIMYIITFIYKQMLSRLDINYKNMLLISLRTCQAYVGQLVHLLALFSLQ